jgi:acetylornithine deacetylase/succinyl-diaminopimelate desuccinylase-like protein
MLQTILKTIEDRKDASLASLKEFLAIPSVSTKPEHAGDLRRCAQWLADQLKFAGFDVAVMPTGGHPAVVAKNRHVAGRPTVLFYGHYDVQPPEPLDLWKSPPFEPTIRNDDNGYPAIFARGAVDDKGQVWAHVEALMCWQAHGGPPVNLILLIEGEEEIGSENLERFVSGHAADLRADICVISDTGQFARGVPAITYGLRGLVYEEIILTGPNHDLHSGLGGTVRNPANVLCELIGTLHDANGRVNIEGFYDDVVSLTDAERRAWSGLPHDDQAYASGMGLSELFGEAGFTTLERQWARPTLDVNGLTAGYQGPGAKTVIASQASAKLSMRLVPNQDPHKIQQLFRETVVRRLPKGITVKFNLQGHVAYPVVTPIDTPAALLAAEAMGIGFGVKPTFIRSGGTIPVVATLKRVLGLDSLLIGFGLPDDRVHSPNEKMDLASFYAGTRTAAALYDKLGRMPAARA